MKMKSRYKYAMYMCNVYVRIDHRSIAGNEEVDEFRDVEVQRTG